MAEIDHDWAVVLTLPHWDGTPRSGDELRQESDPALENLALAYRNLRDQLVKVTQERDEVRDLCKGRTHLLLERDAAVAKAEQAEEFRMRLDLIREVAALDAQVARLEKERDAAIAKAEQAEEIRRQAVESAAQAERQYLADGEELARFRDAVVSVWIGDSFLRDLMVEAVPQVGHCILFGDPRSSKKNDARSTDGPPLLRLRVVDVVWACWGSSPDADVQIDIFCKQEEIQV